MTNGAESEYQGNTPVLSEDIPTLEAEAKQFAEEKDKCAQTIRELMAAEDPRNRISHHEEIYALQQEKLRLEVEIQFRTAKINRLRLGIADAADSDPFGSLF